jgi:hypothetical protein
MLTVKKGKPCKAGKVKDRRNRCVTSCEEKVRKFAAKCKINGTPKPFKQTRKKVKNLFDKMQMPSPIHAPKQPRFEKTLSLSDLPRFNSNKSTFHGVNVSPKKMLLAPTTSFAASKARMDKTNALLNRVKNITKKLSLDKQKRPLSRMQNFADIAEINKNVYENLTTKPNLSLQDLTKPKKGQSKKNKSLSLPKKISLPFTPMKRYIFSPTKAMSPFTSSPLKKTTTSPAKYFNSTQPKQTAKYFNSTQAPEEEYSNYSLESNSSLSPIRTLSPGNGEKKIILQQPTPVLLPASKKSRSAAKNANVMKKIQPVRCTTLKTFEKCVKQDTCNWNAKKAKCSSK